MQISVHASAWILPTWILLTWMPLTWTLLNWIRLTWILLTWVFQVNTGSKLEACSVQLGSLGSGPCRRALWSDILSSLSRLVTQIHCRRWNPHTDPAWRAFPMELMTQVHRGDIELLKKACPTFKSSLFLLMAGHYQVLGHQECQWWPIMHPTYRGYPAKRALSAMHKHDR